MRSGLETLDPPGETMNSMIRYARSPIFRAVNGLIFGGLFAGLVILFIGSVRPAVLNAPGFLANLGLFFLGVLGLASLCLPGFLFFSAGTRRQADRESDPPLLLLTWIWLLLTLPLLWLAGWSCEGMTEGQPCSGAFRIPWRLALIAYLGPAYVLIRTLKRRPNLPQLLFLGLLPFTPANNSLADEKIRFGALTELTGAGAMNGAACRAGYDIAEKLFAEQYPALSGKVEVVYGDHRREQKTAISEFQRLSSLGVWGVACNHSIVGVAVNPLARDANIPLFGVMGHESFVRDNPLAVRIIPTPDEEGGGLARIAYRRGARCNSAP